MEGFPPPPPPQEMGLKHPEKVFDARFNEWAQAVIDLDMRILPREMQFPPGQVNEGERTEKAVKDDVNLIFKQFKKGAQGFAELTAEKGSTFAALAAMVFPENPDLASDLSIEMRFEVGKPPGNDIRVNNQEEELVFQRMPVVSRENCLLAAGLQQMAERRYKDKGNQTVSIMVQLINWGRKENDFEDDSLSDNAIAWLNYRSLSQHLSGAASGIDISLDADKNWHMLAPGVAKQEKQAAGLGWERDEESAWWLSEDKGMFRFEENQLITRAVSPQDFIKIARAVRPLTLAEAARLSSRGDESEDEFDLDSLIDEEEGSDKNTKVPAAPVQEGEEEIPDWFRRLQEEQVAVSAEPEKPAGEKGLKIEVDSRETWSSGFVTIVDDEGVVRITAEKPKFPSDWKKTGTQDRRRWGNGATIKAGERQIRLSLGDMGKELVQFPDVGNQMSYLFDLDLGSSIKLGAIDEWIKRVSRDINIEGAKIEQSLSTSDAFTIVFGDKKYFVCNPTLSSSILISRLAILKGDYNPNKFPSEELFNDLCKIATVLTNSWLGIPMPYGPELGPKESAAEEPELPATPPLKEEPEEESKKSPDFDLPDW